MAFNRCNASSENGQADLFVAKQHNIGLFTSKARVSVLDRHCHRHLIQFSKNASKPMIISNRIFSIERKWMIHSIHFRWQINQNAKEKMKKKKKSKPNKLLCKREHTMITWCASFFLFLLLNLNSVRKLNDFNWSSRDSSVNHLKFYGNLSFSSKSHWNERTRCEKIVIHLISSENRKQRVQIIKLWPMRFHTKKKKTNKWNWQTVPPYLSMSR